MAQVINVVIGLLTTLIGYTVGRIWQKLVDQVPYRRAKIFWGPLLSEEIQIVVSRFKSSAFTEPTGVVGGGDALALREISSYFSKVGLKKYKVVYVDEATLDRKCNLVLLGGSDTNAVTKDALELIKPDLRLFDPGPGITIEIHDLAPPPDAHAGHQASWERAEKKYSPKPNMDYGIIIRAQNPFSPGRWLVIFAGAYGYGTWGGVLLALQDSFLESCEQLESQRYINSSRTPRHYISRSLNRARGFISGQRAGHSQLQLECLFKIGIFDGRPHAPEIISLRPRRELPNGESTS